MRDFFFYRGGILFSHTPERAKNIEDKVFFTTLMSQEGDVENEMPLCEGQPCWIFLLGFCRNLEIFLFTTVQLVLLLHLRIAPSRILQMVAL